MGVEAMVKKRKGGRVTMPIIKGDGNTKPKHLRQDSVCMYE